MTYTLQFEEQPKAEDIQLLSTGIMDYAAMQRGHDRLQFFAFFIRDEHQTIVGGCNGCNLYGCLYVDQLWVHPLLRGKNYGTQLMQSAEQWGQEQGCTFATVNTMDWEARGFYERLGFTVEFERRGFHKDSRFYFLRKELLVTSAALSKPC